MQTIMLRFSACKTFGRLHKLLVNQYVVTVLYLFICCIIFLLILIISCPSRRVTATDNMSAYKSLSDIPIEASPVPKQKQTKDQRRRD